MFITFILFYRLKMEKSVFIVCDSSDTGKLILKLLSRGNKLYNASRAPDGWHLLCKY